MWKTSDLKKKARRSMKYNFKRMVSVCFLIAMLTTAYTSSTFFIHHYNSNSQDFSICELTGNAPTSQIIEDTLEQLVDKQLPVFHSFFGYFSTLLLDLYVSGRSIIFSIIKAMHTLLFREFEWVSVFVLAGVFLAFLYQYFIANILLIGEKRYFLEAKNYPDTKISKLFYLFKLRYLHNPIWVMFCRSMYQILWNLTIVGGIIKHYEYSMIPYILAENPAIDCEKAFHLSKQLMKGNKFHMFRMHLSFIHWRLLSFFTFGLVNLFFTNVYVQASDAELYMILRKKYVRFRLPGYELFNDPILETVPSEDELLISKALYDDSEGPYTQISYFEPNQYPLFLYSIQPPKSAVKPVWNKDRVYDLPTLLFIFFVFSIWGWVFETCMFLTREGVFSNHGLLIGPWMPLYGMCGVFILKFVQKISHLPILSFLSIMTIYSVLEYALNWLMKTNWKISLLTYNGYFMNLNAHTFLGGSIFFALLGCAFLYYLAPKCADYFSFLSKKRKTILLSILSILFIIDVICTFLF